MDPGGVLFLSDRITDRVPYVRKVHTLDFEQGYMDFEGYYYVDDDELPKRVKLFTQNTETNTIEKDPIEIYKRDKHEDVSEYGIDGVCYFPVHRQTIWFRKI